MSSFPKCNENTSSMLVEILVFGQRYNVVVIFSHKVLSVRTDNYRYTIDKKRKFNTHMFNVTSA